MSTLDDLFPSPWLKAEDFAEGEEKQLTIRSWQLNTLPSKNGEKPKKSLDLTFDETEKVLGANYTNREALAKVFGSRDPNDWVGKKATFMTLWVDSWGETVRAVRVKPIPIAAIPSKLNGNGNKAQTVPQPEQSDNATVKKPLKIAQGFDINGFRSLIASQIPYYANKDGSPNEYHITKALIKVGITDLNTQTEDEAFAMLKFHAEAAQQEKQAA